MSTRPDPETAAPLPVWRRDPILRLLTSIWFGVGLLTVILVYSSIVSALPQVRGALEMSEMEAFSHWFFVAVVAAFTVSLVAATVFRCKWNLVGLGGIIVHVGLLVLTVGSVWYFGTKIEGDTLLLSPRVEVIAEAPMAGRQRVGQLLAERGRNWHGHLPPADPVAVRVLAVDGEGAQPVRGVTLAVTVGEATPQHVELAANTAAEVRPGLTVQLRTFPPVVSFYDDRIPALYFQRVGGPSSPRRCAPIMGLPWHRERYTDDGYVVRDTAGRPVPSKRTAPAIALGPLRVPTGWFERWRLPITIRQDEMPFDVTVTGYLPYVAFGESDLYTADGRPVARDEISRFPAEQLVAVPRVVPLEMRRPGQARALSAIRVRLTGRNEHAGWTLTRWLPFQSYPDIDAPPLRVTGPDGSTWDLLYSRYVRDLGFALTGRKLDVTFFPGKNAVESWRSDFIVQLPGQPPQAAAVHTNHTFTAGRWTLFQSNAAGDHWSWTGLGVGNRTGVTPMTLGSILVTLGCLYAFYVKPLILRRRWARAAAAVETEPIRTGAVTNMVGSAS